jgi:hypothetical protein
VPKAWREAYIEGSDQGLPSISFKAHKQTAGDYMDTVHLLQPLEKITMSLQRRIHNQNILRTYFLDVSRSRLAKETPHKKSIELFRTNIGTRIQRHCTSRSLLHYTAAARVEPHDLATTKTKKKKKPFQRGQ